MNERPNILFLFADDQRYNTVAALGNSQILTPNLDRLVARGTAFTHAHILGGTCGAVCMPSRAMLNTGRTLFEIDREGQEIPEDHALLGETLRQSGYHTWCSGKWHNGRRAFHRSFCGGDEIFFGGMADHWNVPAYRFDPTGEYALRPSIPEPMKGKEVQFTDGDHINRGTHSTDAIADAAVRELRGYRGENPFYLYCSFLAPHDPRSMPAKYLEMYRERTVSIPGNFAPNHPFDNGELSVRDEMLAGFPRTEEEIRAHLTDYYAVITHLDEAIGRVISALEETGRSKNTLIVMSGDNGLAVGCHGLMGKQSLYDHSVRVPLIFAGPGIPCGETRNHLACLSDLFPTLCDLTGAKTPRGVSGHSLAPALACAGTPLRDSLFTAYRGLQRAVRAGQYKLIEYVVEGKHSRTQLFDLSADPLEKNDISADPARGGEVTRLRKLLRRLAEEAGDCREQGRAFWSAVPF